MNSLITACLRKNNPTPLIEFPRQLMDGIEIKMIDFSLGYLSKHGELPAVDRFAIEFPMFVPVVEELPATDIAEQGVKRRTLMRVGSMLSDALTTMSETKEIPREIISKIQEVISVASGVHKYSDFDRSLYIRKAEFSIPFKLINRATGGMGGGEVLVIAGRLGTGKSTILRWLTKSAMESKKRVLFISTESLAREVFAALDGMMTKRSIRVVRDESKKYDLVKRVVTSGEVFIPASRMVNTTDLSALAKSLNVDMIVVDGVYLLKPTERTSSSRWERVAAVSNEIKQMALDLKIPVICSTQIKRGATDSGWYDAEDIALSDSIAQDADFLVTVRPDGVIKNRIEFQLIKNRFGYNCSTIIFLDHENSTVVDESIEGEVDVKREEPEVISMDEWGGR